jgi:hypothetical protein
VVHVVSAVTHVHMAVDENCRKQQGVSTPSGERAVCVFLGGLRFCLPA